MVYISAMKEIRIYRGHSKPEMLKLGREVTSDDEAMARDIFSKLPSWVNFLVIAK